MNARERFNCIMAFEKPDRPFITEFMGYWPETLDRWRDEGMPRDVGAHEYFELDKFAYAPVDFNFVPAFERKILEEDEQTRTVRDELGVIKREFKYGSAMPHYIEFPIKTRQDFLGLVERLDPTSPERYPSNWPGLVEQYRNRDYPLGLICRGLLAFGRDFMEFTDLMMAFAEDLDWMEEMMEFHLDFMMRFWERALRDVEIDFVYLGEDMAYKAGPMISPAMVKALMVPRYQRLTSFLKDCGVKTIFVDSDGDIRSLIPLFLEGGNTGVLPLEHNAGCDPVALRKQYPKLQMIGGMSKQAIALGGESMENEVRSKLSILPQGGYIPSFDHSVHPAVSLQTYREYLDLLRDHKT